MYVLLFLNNCKDYELPFPKKYVNVVSVMKYLDKKRDDYYIITVL